MEPIFRFLIVAFLLVQNVGIVFASKDQAAKDQGVISSSKDQGVISATKDQGVISASKDHSRYHFSFDVQRCKI